MTSRKTLIVYSFAYRTGWPPELVEQPPAIVRDVRIGTLHNPYKLAEFHDLSGLDEPVQDFVVSQPGVQEMIDRALADIVSYLDSPNINPIVAAFGCTGGKDRSVAIASAVADQAIATLPLVVVTRHLHVHRRAGADQRSYE